LKHKKKIKNNKVLSHTEVHALIEKKKLPDKDTYISPLTTNQSSIFSCFTLNNDNDKKKNHQIANQEN
jgi:hypothetical protein